MNFLTLLLSLFLLLTESISTERYWQRGCAQQGNYTSVEEWDSHVAMDWRKPVRVYYSAELSCSEKPFFCAMFYYTLRHPEKGPICPYAFFEPVRCANGQGMIRFNSFFNMSSKEKELSEIEYETNMEIYHNCFGDEVTQYFTKVHAVDGRASCQFHHFPVDLNGKGTHDFEKAPAERFLFDQKNWKTHSERFLSGLDVLTVMNTTNSSDAEILTYPGPCDGDTVLYKKA